MFPMVVVSTLFHVEFGLNGQQDDAPHFTIRSESGRKIKKAIFFLRQTGERDENSASLDLSKIQIFWSRSDVPNQTFSHTAPLGYLPVTNPDLDKAINVKPNLPPEIKLHQAFNLELSITNGKAQNSSSDYFFPDDRIKEHHNILTLGRIVFEPWN